MTRKRLSVVVITKNEEARIARCLGSVSWADERILVDGYSSDRTTEIAQSLGAKIVLSRFNGSFDRERNQGIDAASGDWILQLDADEIVTTGLRGAIEAILAQDPPFSAYKFKRKNFFLGHAMRFGGWYHDSLHFFRKGRARYQGRIHEALIVDGPIGRLQEEVEHTPFESLSQFLERHNRYSSLEAERILEERGILPWKEVRYHLVWKPLKLFWKFYVKKQGFRDGWVGLLFSGLYAWVHFLNWAKYWELVQVQSSGSMKGRSIS